MLATFGMQLPAEAQSYCFPRANGVPHRPNAPDMTASDLGVEEAAWRGAFGVSGVGATGDDFFALREVDASGKVFLNLAFDVFQEAGQPDTEKSGVWVGFAQLNASNAIGWAYMFYIAPSNMNTAGYPLPNVPAGMNPPLVAQRSFKWNGSRFEQRNNSAAPFYWPDMTGYYDISCAGTPNKCEKRTLRLRIPTGANDTAGLPVGTSPVKFFYEMRHSGANNGFAPSSWPLGLDVIAETGIPPAPNVTAAKITGVAPFPAWANIVLEDPNATNNCGGIALADPASIFVSNELSTDGARIDYRDPVGTNLRTSTFHVQPTNSNGRSLNGDTIQARMRIADWGSANKSSPRWRTIGNCENATQSSSIDVTQDAKFDLTCQWTLNADERCDYSPECDFGGPILEDHDDHQCILVDLAMNPGRRTTLTPQEVANGETVAPAQVFSVRSQYRNFNFAKSSQITRNASIDIGGTGLNGFSLTRDTFLYVSTSNMPTPDDLNGDGYSPRGETYARYMKLLLDSGALSLRDVQKDMPSYTVYVTYDTGRTVTQRGKSYRLHAFQPSFGLMPYHDGSIYGWLHALTGPGLVSIAKDYYRLPIPINGKAKVTINIVSDENGDGMCSLTPWNQWPWQNFWSGNPFPWNAWPTCWWNWLWTWLGNPLGLP